LYKKMNSWLRNHLLIRTYLEAALEGLDLCTHQYLVLPPG
jgi:hypothetical protein